LGEENKIVKKYFTCRMLISMEINASN